jgi:hypothetical protein
VPKTPAIISQVCTLAEQERMPDSLKIFNQTGQLFYDSAWIAGVDYDIEAFDDAQDEDHVDDKQDSDNEDDLLFAEDYNKYIQMK